MKILDISIPIRSGMPIWPGDPAVTLTQISAIAKGDSANITHLSMGVHTGTHIDAPKHFIDDGETVDQIPLQKLIGKVIVIEIDKHVNVISEQILKSHPSIHRLVEIQKVLFRTRNSWNWNQASESFNINYVGIDSSGARFLSQFRLDLIGIDYLSIASYDDTEIPHKTLLSEGIILLEGLNLFDVPEGIYQLYCLPLTIHGGEGAPARAVLIDRLE